MSVSGAGFIRENVPLSGLTSFGIGGPARYLACPATRAELFRAAELAAAAGLPLLALGGGSNLLAADAGVAAVVARLDGGGEFGRIEADPGNELVWRVGAAATLAELVAAAARAGAAGLEALAGIPGRVGGAAAMNAGGANAGIGEYIAAAEVFDPATGRITELSAVELGFSYRKSNLAGWIGLRFVLNFSGRAAPEELAARGRECRERKKASQPLDRPSAGCVFKNPSGTSAGRLLDQAGCKGMREGGAAVSGLHANFIVNAGGAGSGDVARLARRMRDAVQERSGVRLEPELVMWGDDPAFHALR